MRRFALLAALMAAPAQADTICEWMGYTEGVVSAIPSAPGTMRNPEQERVLTQVALAMFEATNAIDQFTLGTEPQFLR